jgi:hypothetical protein
MEYKPEVYNQNYTLNKEKMKRATVYTKNLINFIKSVRSSYFFFFDQEEYSGPITVVYDHIKDEFIFTISKYALKKIPFLNNLIQTDFHNDGIVYKNNKITVNNKVIGSYIIYNDLYLRNWYPSGYSIQDFDFME